MSPGRAAQAPRRPDAAPRLPVVQLALGGADRLVSLLDESGEPMPAVEAATLLFALRAAPAALARRLVEEVVAEDARIVLDTRGRVALASWRRAPSMPLEQARFVVVDLETTGVGRDARIVEIGAAVVAGLELGPTFTTLVDPGVPLPPTISRLTGIRQRDLRGASPLRPSLRSFLRFAGDGVLVAHNARFDAGMLDRALVALESRRLALPVLDTVALARRLLEGRVERFGLGSLARRFDTAVQPCHRALPDAQATAEVLLALIGLAQERGATDVEGLLDLAASAPRRVRRRAHLARSALPGPGVYVMRDAHGQALYVGKAGDLRARTRSYFGPRRQKPTLEAALLAATRIDVAPLGSELEASLAELHLIRAWRPPANVEGARPDRYVYLRLGIAEGAPTLGVRGEPRADGALYAGPFRSRRRAEEAASALRDAFGLRTCRPRVPVDDGSCLRGLLGRCRAPCRGAPEAAEYAAAISEVRRFLEGLRPAPTALRERMADLACDRRFEQAARERKRAGGLAVIEGALGAVRRALARTGVLLAPALRPERVRALAVRGGVVVDTRNLPRHGEPWAELGPLVASLSATAALPALEPPPPAGPWLPAGRYDDAVVLAGAFAGRSRDVVAIAVPGGAPADLVVQRIAEARKRVPLRVALGEGAIRDWRRLERIEAPEASVIPIR